MQRLKKLRTMISRTDVHDMGVFSREIEKRLLRRSKKRPTNKVERCLEVTLAIGAEARIIVANIAEDDIEDLELELMPDRAIDALGRELHLLFDSHESQSYVKEQRRAHSRELQVNERGFCLTYLFVFSFQPPTALDGILRDNPGDLVRILERYLNESWAAFQTHNEWNAECGPLTVFPEIVVGRTIVESIRTGPRQ